ncbi:MAG: hypothetical protein ACTHKU_06100 [Verrucomicrobiota bacterium]
MFSRIRDKLASAKTRIPKPRSPRVASGKLFDVATIAAIFLALCALAALIFYNVVPIRTADIKVPVATDKSSYYPEQDVSGIFFGDTYFKGEVRILREVFCKDYKATIAPPAGNAFGDFFSTQTEPRHFEGQSVYIGKLPADVPVGSNCVLQFTNVYVTHTPFGERTERYQYYTQNFAIISKERRMQLDCEATGKSTTECAAEVKERLGRGDSPESTTEEPSDITSSSTPAQITPRQSSGTASAAPSTPNQTTNNTTNNSTTNNTTNNPPAEPAPRPIEVCTIDVLGIRTLCRVEYR